MKRLPEHSRDSHSALLTVAPAIQAQGTPRLVVMLVVDQMRADYLQTFDRHWHGGFRTLLTEGLVFDNARYPYLNTLTCAGHSTIGTGALPHTHGMVANAWWDRSARRMFGCTSDPEATDISYGRPAQIGNSGKTILVPTLADELRAQKPGARVVSLSLKARSAIGLAGHGGDAVVWFDDESGSFATSRAFASAPVPAVKAFIDAHPYEQENGSSWTLSAPADSYVMRDAGVGERPPASWSGLFPHRLAGRNGVDAQFFQLWQASPRSDAYLEGLAESLIDSLALGQRDTTDFLGISFSALDEVGHSFGPESREIEDVLRQLDVALQRLIAHLDAKVGRANYMLALSADHGVAPIASAPLGGRIANEDVRERIDETLTGLFGEPTLGSYVEAANFTDVYLRTGRIRSTQGIAHSDGHARTILESDPGHRVRAAIGSAVGQELGSGRQERFTELPRRPERRPHSRAEEILVLRRESWRRDDARHAARLRSTRPLHSAWRHCAARSQPNRRDARGYRSHAGSLCGRSPSKG